MKCAKSKKNSAGSELPLPGLDVYPANPNQKVYTLRIRHSQKEVFFSCPE
jgi:hypothetical protein